MHIAVIMPRWVGDAVMATPALRALRGHFPQARITGVMRPVIGDLLAGTAWLDDAIAYDRHRRDSACSFAAAVRGLRAARPDIAVILPNSLSSAALAWWGGGRRRVGAVGHWRRWLLTDPVPAHRDDRGRVTIVPPPQAFLDAVAAVGVPPGPLTVELVATATELAAADEQQTLDLRHAILELEDDYREPLVLQVLMGLTTDEIASQLGLTQAAVLIIDQGPRPLALLVAGTMAYEASPV